MKKLLTIIILALFLTSCGPKRMKCGPKRMCDSENRKTELFETKKT